MKTPYVKMILLCFLFVCTYSLSAQDNWASFTKSIPVKGYEGKKFRVQAYLLTAGDDEDASVQLLARVQKTDGTNGFFKSDQENQARAPQWKLYTLEGTIDSAADLLYVGVLARFNGKFYMDDLAVTIENGKKWKTIYTIGFESESTALTPGLGTGDTGKNNLYTATFTKEKFRNGKQGFVITGKNVPNFGTNREAGKYADVNGIRLYYEIYGSGQPLVILHGNGGSIASAGPHYPALMKKYKVIAVDSRAQGKSTDTEAPLTYDQMAADVNALLEQLHTDSVFIWGQSDGAILGLLLAMDYPDKVKRVVAYGSNIQPDTSAIFPWGIAAIEKFAKETRDQRTLKLNQLMLDYPKIPYARLRTIQAPVLVMAGDRDIIRPEHTLKIFQNIPRSQLCILPGSTHGGSWEKQELFLNLIDNFFLQPFSMPDTKSWF